MGAPEKQSPRIVNVVLVGGSPERSSVRAFLYGLPDKYVVAVDRGLDVLLDAELACDLFCGDADTVSEIGAAYVVACETGAPSPVRAVERFDPHKDFTDLDLALRAIRERFPDDAMVTLWATCLGGGSPDHFLGALGRLAGASANYGWSINLVEDGYIGWILSARQGEGVAVLEPASPGKRFSFVPLSPTAVVSESGMRWNLNEREVPLLSDLGISNVLESEEAQFTVHDGTAACWVFD